MQIQLEEIDRGSLFYGLDIEPDYFVQGQEDLSKV
jgi:hypothetical protein